MYHFLLLNCHLVTTSFRIYRNGSSLQNSLHCCLFHPKPFNTLPWLTIFKVWLKYLGNTCWYRCESPAHQVFQLLYSSEKMSKAIFLQSPMHIAHCTIWSQPLLCAFKSMLYYIFSHENVVIMFSSTYISCVTRHGVELQQNCSEGLTRLPAKSPEAKASYWLFLLMMFKLLLMKTIEYRLCEWRVAYMCSPVT